MPTTPNPTRIKASVVSLTASLVVAALFIATAVARKADRARSPEGAGQ